MELVEAGSVPKSSWPGSRNELVRWAAVAVVTYLCWRLLAPFLPALAFGFALAMLGDPLYRWLVKVLRRPTAAASIAVLLICLTLVVPLIFLAQVLTREAIQGIATISDPTNLDNVRSSLERRSSFRTSPLA